ncbi:hypothetical protein YYE_04756, partial [Plasmodium vinckei vinckei]
MCKLLLEGDSYFKGKDVDTTKINNNTKVKSYCSSDGCKTNEERINALTVYIYMKFKNSIRKTNYNKYDECFLMWLSDKLFNMYHESKGENKKKGFVYLITLNKAYDKYLKDHKVYLNYWELFDSIKGLKEANLKYMSEFYKLFNIICNTIVDYKDNGAGSKKLSKYSGNCLNQYRTLYMNIYECKSYLDLLNKLKGIYDDFRSHAIKKNPLNNNLATNLKKLIREDGVEMNAVRSFKTYNFSDSKCKFSKKKTASSKKMDKSSLQPSNQLKDTPKLQSSPEPAPPTEQTKDNQEKTTQPSVSKPGLKNDQKTSDIPTKVQSNEQKDSGTIKLQNISSSVKNSFEIFSNFFMKVATNNIKSLYHTVPPLLENVYHKSISFVDTTVNYVNEQLNKALENDPPNKEKKLEPPPSLPDPEKKEPQDTPTQTQDGQTNNHSEEPSSIQKNDSTDSKQVNPSDSGGNQSGSGGTGDNSPTSNDPSPPQKDSNQQNTPQQNSHKQNPQQTSPDQPETSQNSQKLKNPEAPQDSQGSQTSQNSILPISTEQTKILQPYQDPSGNQNSDQKSQEGLQKPGVVPVIIPEHPGSEVNGNETIGICDMYIFKKYKKFVISTIVLLISIALAIMHKYLSFGRRKKLNGKKNMKKVINSIGGKKQIQIIIKSSNQKKNTKKSINS